MKFWIGIVLLFLPVLAMIVALVCIICAILEETILGETKDK